MMTDISLREAQVRVSEKIHPRVTLESITAKIKQVSYLYEGTLTICIVLMQNDFRVVGKSAPADSRNFDPDVGRRFAYEDAFKQLWPLEGYLLCELLHPGGAT